MEIINLTILCYILSELDCSNSSYDVINRSILCPISTFSKNFLKKVRKVEIEQSKMCFFWILCNWILRRKELPLLNRPGLHELSEKIEWKNYMYLFKIQNKTFFVISLKFEILEIERSYSHMTWCGPLIFEEWFWEILTLNI